MRTNIDIDDGLMREAMRRSGAATKKAAVEAGLRLLVQRFSQGSIRKLKGKVVGVQKEGLAEVVADGQNTLGIRINRRPKLLIRKETALEISWPNQLSADAR